MHGLELLGAGLGTLGIWLGTRRRLASYPLNLAASLVYGFIFIQVKLYSDALLQLAFIAFILYGWAHWARHLDTTHRVIISRLPLKQAALHLALGAAGAVLLGALMHHGTDAALPWLDATLAAGSLVATFWSARRHIANWWLWITLDLAYIGLYIYKGLWITAGFYALLVGLAAYGLSTWIRASSKAP